jgi:hypothetical protein
MEEFDTRRKTEGECAAAAAWMGFARTRVLQRAIARAPSRVKARLPLNARPGTESAHLLLPVMISRKPRFAWRFREITGEFFSARSPRAGSTLSFGGRVRSVEEERHLLYLDWPHASPHLKKAALAGESAGDSAGPESPALESQVIDSKQDLGKENFSRKSHPAEVVFSGATEPSNSDFNPSPPRVGEASRARQRA